MSKNMSHRDNEKKFNCILAADALKQYTVLQGAAKQQCQTQRRGGNKEAHPKAVLSTKHKQDDPSAPKGCSSPHDCTTPVNTASMTLTRPCFTKLPCVLTYWG